MAFNAPAAAKARDRELGAGEFSGRLDREKAAAGFDLIDRTVQDGPGKMAAAFGPIVQIDQIVPARAAAERNGLVFGLTIGPMAIDSPTVGQMETDSPTVAPDKVAAELSGIATTGRTGLLITGPIAYQIAIGGTIGAATATTTAGNIGTVTGTITITGTTTIGG